MNVRSLVARYLLPRSAADPGQGNYEATKRQLPPVNHRSRLHNAPRSAPFTRPIRRDTLSESVSSASIAGSKKTLPTLKDVLRKSIVTLLAIVPPTDPFPALMVAVVVFPQIFGHLTDLGCQIVVIVCDFWLLSSHQQLGSVQETILVPLWTVAGLPSGAAEVAELCMTEASRRRF